MKKDALQIKKEQHRLSYDVTSDSKRLNFTSSNVGAKLNEEFRAIAIEMLNSEKGKLQLLQMNRDNVTLNYAKGIFLEKHFQMNSNIYKKVFCHFSFRYSIQNIIF